MFRSYGFKQYWWEIVYPIRTMLYLEEAYSYLRSAFVGICVAGCFKWVDWLMMCGLLFNSWPCP